MKKYLTMLMCAGLLFTITGCGDETKEEGETSNDTTTTTNVQETAKSKVLSCSVSYSGMGEEMVFTYDSEGKEMSDVSASMYMEYDEEMLEEITDEDIEAICDEVDADQDAISYCKATLKDNTLYVDVKYDLSKITKGDEYSFDKDTSLEELKEYFEDEEMTCEVTEK